MRRMVYFVLGAALATSACGTPAPTNTSNTNTASNTNAAPKQMALAPTMAPPKVKTMMEGRGEQDRPNRPSSSSRRPTARRSKARR